MFCAIQQPAGPTQSGSGVGAASAATGTLAAGAFRGRAAYLHPESRKNPLHPAVAALRTNVLDVLAAGLQGLDHLAAGLALVLVDRHDYILPVIRPYRIIEDFQLFAQTTENFVNLIPGIDKNYGH